MFVDALDFVRHVPNKEYKIYHHIGIYAFTNEALLRYVNLKRSKLELERKLEQLRALENGMIIKVVKTKDHFIGVDTQKDLNKVRNKIKNQSESN